MGIFGSSNKRYRKAKTACQCDLCKKTIGRGEEYLAEAVSFKGRVHQVNLHPKCKTICLEYMRRNCESGFTFREIERWVEDIFCRYHCVKFRVCHPVARTACTLIREHFH